MDQRDGPASVSGHRHGLSVRPGDVLDFGPFKGRVIEFVTSYSIGLAAAFYRGLFAAVKISAVIVLLAVNVRLARAYRRVAAKSAAKSGKAAAEAGMTDPKVVA